MKIDIRPPKNPDKPTTVWLQLTVSGPEGCVSLEIRITVFVAAEPRYIYAVHRREPDYEGATPYNNCQFLRGPCYGDSTSKTASEMMELMATGGLAAVQAEMEAEYRRQFPQLALPLENPNGPA